MDRRVGSELARAFEARLVDVGDQAAGAMQLRDLEHRQADCARAVDQHRVVRVDAGARKDVRGDRERFREGRDLERHRGRHLDAVGRRHPQPVPEAAVAVDAENLEVAADVRTPDPASVAMPARHDRVDDDMVADRDPVDLRTDRLDGPGKLVADDAG